jgi:hypothetical protein
MGSRDTLNFFISAESSADPLLDEHFRRSLGADYQAVFKRNSPAASSPHPKESTERPKLTAREFRDRFYKTPFWPKTFRKKIFILKFRTDIFPFKMTDINLLEYYGQQI